MEFYRGGVAFLDVLGFKGIWKRVDPTTLLAKWYSMQQYIEERAQVAMAFSQHFKGEGRLDETPKVDVHFLSDSIVLTTGVRKYQNAPQEVLDATFVTSAAFSAHIAMLAGLLFEPPLNFRGAISCGEYIALDTIVMGPAIDEAADLHGQLDGAMTRVCPAAEVAFLLGIETAPTLSKLAVKHLIPMKKLEDDRVVRTVESGILLNPFALDFGPASVIEETTIKAFGRVRSPDVERKYANTMAFHAVARKAAGLEPLRTKASAKAERRQRRQKG